MKNFILKYGKGIIGIILLVIIISLVIDGQIKKGVSGMVNWSIKIVRPPQKQSPRCRTRKSFPPSGQGGFRTDALAWPKKVFFTLVPRP